MVSKLIKIEEKEARLSLEKVDISFVDFTTDRVFGIIQIADNLKYLVGWASNLLEPTVLEINDKWIAIGIDLKLILIDLNTNEVKINHALGTFFLDFHVKDKYLLAAAQLEIHIINLETLAITIEGLPDVFDGFILEKEKMHVKLMDGSVIPLNLR